MSNLLVIAIAGKARAGKDTIAAHLVQRHGFTRIALGDGVRSAITDLDGPTWELRKQIEVRGKTSRWAAQTLGTESRLAIPGAANHWIDHLLIKLEFMANRIVPGRSKFVIPDMRFVNEHSRLGNSVAYLGGEFQSWKVLRSGSGLNGPESMHASEQEIDQIESHVTLSNDSPIASLLKHVDRIAEVWIK